MMEKNLVNDEELIGTCDTCDTEYDVSSREGRCGGCGECSYHCTHAERLPQRINVMRLVSYDVQQITNDLIEAGQEDGTVVLSDIVDYIEDLVAEDFGCGYGHTANTKDLIWQDENGEDI